MPELVKIKPKCKVIALPRLMAKCQSIFNEYIRLRDKGHKCISCGSDKANQAGHYFSVKQNSNLRFNEVNVNLQCAYCNCYMHGNQANYIMGLRKKYGARLLKELERASLSDRHKKWKRSELEDLVVYYRKEVVRIKCNTANTI